MRFRTRASSAADDAERSRALIDGLPQLVWSALPDGRVDWFNERWHAYTGLPRHTGPQDGRHWLDRLHPDDVVQARAAWQHALTSGEPYAAEFRLRAHDGGYRWFVTRALPQRGAGGRIVRWCGSCTDIDAHKRATLSSDGFVALVSHALRTPLNAILGWTQVLQKRPEDVATVRQVAEVVERNARAQVRMVDDLLDASRLAAGSLTLSIEPLDLRELLHTVVQAARAHAQGRQIEFEVPAGTAPLAAQADAQRLRQAVAGLLTNALQATGDAGRIMVRLRVDEGCAVIEVADDGRGIAPGDLPHVFDRFQQSNAALSRRTGNLGLGLSIVQGLVALHGGSVEAASAGPERGAVFTVRLPLASAAVSPAAGGLPTAAGAPPGAASAVPAPAPAANALAGLRVLVVDDEADSRALAARVLQDAGAGVTQADGADEVSIALGRGLRPDLVISDLGMPRVDGYSLMRMLRELPGAMREVPTIALSGLNLPQDRARAAQAGFSAFLSKPFSPAELVAVAARLTGRHG